MSTTASMKRSSRTVFHASPPGLLLKGRFCCIPLASRAEGSTGFTTSENTAPASGASGAASNWIGHFPTPAGTRLGTSFTPGGSPSATISVSPLNVVPWQGMRLMFTVHWSPRGMAKLAHLGASHQ